MQLKKDTLETLFTRVEEMSYKTAITANCVFFFTKRRQSRKIGSYLFPLFSTLTLGRATAKTQNTIYPAMHSRHLSTTFPFRWSYKTRRCIEFFSPAPISRRTALFDSTGTTGEGLSSPVSLYRMDNPDGYSWTGHYYSRRSATSFPTSLSLVKEETIRYLLIFLIHLIEVISNSR